MDYLDLFLYGVDEDEPSIVRSIVGTIIHWKLWAMLGLLMASLYLVDKAVVYASSQQESAVAGYWIGLAATYIIVEWLDP